MESISSATGLLGFRGGHRRAKAERSRDIFSRPSRDPLNVVLSALRTRQLRLPTRIIGYPRNHRRSTFSPYRNLFLRFHCLGWRSDNPATGYNSCIQQQRGSPQKKETKRHRYAQPQLSPMPNKGRLKREKSLH